MKIEILYILQRTALGKPQKSSSPGGPTTQALPLELSGHRNFLMIYNLGKRQRT